MYEAFKRFTPDSNWISAGLLTLLVVSFGIFAEYHAGPSADPKPVELTGTCHSEKSLHSQTGLNVIRFH